MFLTEQEAAQKLGISTTDLVELIRDGALPAHHKDGEWLIEPRDIDRLPSRYGTRDPKELLRRVSRDEVAKDHETFGTSRFLLDLLRATSWVTLALSLILTVIAVATHSTTPAIIGGGVVLASIGYIVAYDLMQAVFSINNTLQRLALDVAEMRNQRRD